MNVSEAVAADRSGHLEEAANLYERAVGAGNASLETLLNLAVLYWQVTDYGISTALGLRKEFIDTAGRRFPEILARAEHEHPASGEVKFWRRYIRWADLGESLTSEDCASFMEREPSVLTPAMHIYAQSGGAEAEASAMELLRRCKDDGTTRARYVYSVIDGVRRRRSRGFSRQRP